MDSRTVWRWRGRFLLEGPDERIQKDPAGSWYLARVYHLSRGGGCVTFDIDAALWASSSGAAQQGMIKQHIDAGIIGIRNAKREARRHG